jgi:hypothetical protein
MEAQKSSRFDPTLWLGGGGGGLLLLPKQQTALNYGASTKRWSIGTARSARVLSLELACSLHYTAPATSLSVPSFSIEAKWNMLGTWNIKRALCFELELEARSEGRC